DDRLSQCATAEQLRSLGLEGTEAFTIRGLESGLKPGQPVEVDAAADGGSPRRFSVSCRLDNQTDVEYLRHGGVLPMVRRQVMGRCRRRARRKTARCDRLCAPRMGRAL